MKAQNESIRCNPCTFKICFREAQKLQGASSTLTILPPCPFCLFYDVSKVSIRTVRSSGRQSTPDLPQSSILPGRHPKPAVPSLRVSYSSFSTVSFHRSPLMKPLCFSLFSTEQTKLQSVDEPGRAAGVDSDDSDDVIVSPSRPVRRREVLIS